MQFERISTVVPDGDDSTRARVIRTIAEQGPRTAADLAAALDLTAAAVRRHLDHLVESGVLESREQRVAPGTRGRGRPARAFRLTQAGRDQLDNQYDDLATQALRFLRDTGGDEAVIAFARQRVEFIERDYAALAAERADLSPAEALAEVLTRGGYAAGVQTLPIGEQLCQQHCPVSHVAHKFPQLCEAETEAFSRVLGSHVQRLATIAHGDGVCTTCIPTVSTSSTSEARSTNHQKDGGSR